MGMKLIKVKVSSRGIYSYIHRTDESDPSTQTLYTQKQVDGMDADIHEFEGSYLDAEKKKHEISADIDKLKEEIKVIEQQCMRPLLEIHYLQSQGKDTAKEDAFLNQRYGQILIKRAELQGLDNA